MKKALNILENYKKSNIAKQVSPSQKQDIKKAVSKAFKEYGETYKRLASE